MDTVTHEVYAMFRRGYILEAIGDHFRKYFHYKNPCHKKAVFDALDPTTTFYPPATYHIRRQDYFYPPTTETKGLNAFPIVGQYRSSTWYKVLTRRPSANGTIQFDTQFPVSGAHWDKVAEDPHDGDGTYVAETAPAEFLWDRDTFAIPAMGVDYDWAEIWISAYAKKVTTATGNMRLCVESAGAVNAEPGLGNPLTQVYLQYQYNWTTNPWTGLPWTTASLNALLIGAMFGNLGVGQQNRLTQIYVDIYSWMHSLYRGYLDFDTSPLGASATVTAALLYLAIQSDHSDTDFDMHFYSGMDVFTGVGDLDWDDCAVDEGVFFNTAGKAVNTYYSHSVLTTSINLTGHTQFRCKTDREGTKPSGDEYIFLYGWGTAYKPKLEVTYTLPPPAVKAGLHPSKPLSVILDS